MNALTLANQLTLLRMLLIPAFVILVVYGHLGWALTVFVTAGITDGLDGLIARRSGQKTTIGAWLDPMADKLLLVTTFVVLTLPGLDLANRLPIWLTVLIISRDVGIVLTVAIINLAVGHRTFRPSFFGKAATAIYILTAVVAMLFNYLRYRSRVVDTFVYASLAITLLSGFHYIWWAARAFDPAAEKGVGSAERAENFGNAGNVRNVGKTSRSGEDQLKRVKTR
jgi:cardiolipin synthase